MSGIERGAAEMDVLAQDPVLAEIVSRLVATLCGRRLTIYESEER